MLENLLVFSLGKDNLQIGYKMEEVVMSEKISVISSYDFVKHEVNYDRYFNILHSRNF